MHGEIPTAPLLMNFSSQLSHDVVKVLNLNSGVAALKNDGTVITWGDSNYWGNYSSTINNVSRLYANRYAFAALKEDGSVETWGQPNYGGDSSSFRGDSISVSSQLSSGVIEIYPAIFSFAALKDDGTVVTWGGSATRVNGVETNTGQDSSEVSSQLNNGEIIDIVTNGYAFAALLALPTPPSLNLLDNYNILENSSQSIDAVPISGSPSVFTYQWYFDNFTIPSNFGGTASTFTMDGVQSNEGGVES